MEANGPDWGKVTTSLTVLLIVAGIGFFWDFQNVKAVAHDNKNKIIASKSRIDLVAYMLCEEKIKKDPEEAPKICKKLLMQFDKNSDT